MPDPAVVALAEALADRYRLERELGRGGMATVWLARDLRHDRLVALKLLRPELSAALGAERFLREIQVTARLQHPHILPLHDSGAVGDHLFYVMPYVEGESLRDRLARERQLPLEAALEITRAVAYALGYAHERGVVHRDIKPENILLTRQGDALVADFGIARALGGAGDARLTETGLAVGTPAYMAPEQATGDAVDARSDVYALGCVLYEMLAGEPPYSGPTAQAVIAKRLREPVPRLGTLRQVPPGIEAAVTRALARTPADRFPTADAFSAALAQAATKPGPGPGHRLPARRVVALGTALALVTVAGLVALRRGGASSSRLDPKRVSVAVFENRTGEPSLDPLGLTIADYVSRALLKTGLVSVGDIGTLYVQGRDAAGRPTDARSLARQAGAAHVIVGSYTAEGDSVELAAAVIDVATGSLRQSFDPVRSPKREPMAALARLQQQVAAGLAATVDRRFSTFATQTTAPPSYEAYRAFAEGQERFWRGEVDSTALALFRRAAAADPGFLTAAVWLAFASAAPLWACPTTDSVIRALSSARDRLDPLDRFNLDWSGAYCRGDAEELHRIAVASAHLQPSSAYAKYWVALWASFSNRQQESIRILTALDRSRDLEWMPDSAKFLYYRDLARSYHLAGDYGHELETAREYTAREPHTIKSLWLRARALAGLGRAREALGLLDSARARPDDQSSWDVASPPYFAIALANELDFHGDSQAARSAAERALTYFRRRTDTVAYAELVWAALRAGRQDEARHLLAIPRDRRWPAMWVGAAAALALDEGDTALARRMDDSLARGKWPYEWGRAILERARLAAARGDRARAVELLRTYQASHGSLVGVVVHWWPGFASLRGYPPFEALLRDTPER